MVHGRALHFVFKIIDRRLTMAFYKNVLGMKILRHEEFSEGCEATCNGPYANRWSKTMVGYGPEDNHFVIELTYNYGITEYEQGNDFIGITIQSSEAIRRASAMKWPVEIDEEKTFVTSPGGYRFYIIDKPQPVNKDPVLKVSLASSNLSRSIEYWNGVLDLKIYKRKEKKVLLCYEHDQVKLELVDIGKEVRHEKAYGRIAFSCPFDEQPIIENRVRVANGKILTPLISLDTPGKTTVRVIILIDPDDHEICFVDDERFRILSKVDPKSESNYAKFIKADKSSSSFNV